MQRTAAALRIFQELFSVRMGFILLSTVVALTVAAATDSDRWHACIDCVVDHVMHQTEPDPAVASVLASIDRDRRAQLAPFLIECLLYRLNQRVFVRQPGPAVLARHLNWLIAARESPPLIDALDVILRGKPNASFSLVLLVAVMADRYPDTVLATVHLLARGRPHVSALVHGAFTMARAFLSETSSDEDLAFFDIIHEHALDVAEPNLGEVLNEIPGEIVDEVRDELPVFGGSAKLSAHVPEPFNRVRTSLALDLGSHLVNTFRLLFVARPDLIRSLFILGVLFDLSEFTWTEFSVGALRTVLPFVCGVEHALMQADLNTIRTDLLFEFLIDEELLCYPDIVSRILDAVLGTRQHDQWRHPDTGRTLLHVAVQADLTDAVQKLVARSPDLIQVRDCCGLTPFDYKTPE